MLFIGYLLTWITLPTALVFLSTLMAVHILTRKEKNLPPGPTPLPVIGNLLLFAGKNFLDVIDKLRSEHGDILSLKMGSERIIVLNGYENIHEAFVKQADDFSDRPIDLPPVQVRQGHGVILSSGELWKQTRSFTLRSLRDFGFGKKSLESRIMEEVNYFTEAIEKTGCKDFNLHRMTQISVCNVICSIINGQRYKHDDPDLNRLLELLDENIRLVSPVTRALTPYLKHVPFDPFKIKKLDNNNLTIMEFQRDIIKSHSKNLNYNDKATDLVDAFLLEGKINNSSVFSDIGIVSVIFDLYIAGTETTSTTIRWAVLLVLHHLEIQEKLYQEISNVIGFSRKPSMDDKPNMPFFQAFVEEVLRFANIATFAVPHFTTHDVVFKGHTIPKGCTIMPNLQSVMRDPKIFPEPNKFDPSRFIDDHGMFVKSPKVIPFGTGRRVCLGEALARMELFLFLTTMFQYFEFLPSDSLPDLKGVFGGTHSPGPFLCRAKRRNIK